MTLRVFADHDRDVARTDYILAALRRELGPCVEAYVKWWFGGAFNGAGFVRGDGTSALVEFLYTQAGGQRGRPEPGTLGGIEVRIGVWPWVAELPIDVIVEEANRRFEEALPSGAWEPRVQRVCFWCYGQGAGDAAPLRTMAPEEVAAVLALALGGEARVGGGTTPPSVGDFDVEVTLPAPLAPDEVTRRIRTLWRRVDGSLFGAGAGLDALEALVPKLPGATVYARQF